MLILGSLPFWAGLCGWGFAAAVWPPAGQLTTVAVVAATGLIATSLFYKGTDRVSRDPDGLAAVESTQADEIIFTLVFEAMLIGIALPTAMGWLGLELILTGFILHARPRRLARVNHTLPSA